jgi:hypothetical protein
VTRPPEPEVEESSPCPYCGSQAEPEQDGEVVFFACPDCGGAFGYRRVSQGQFCAAGLPVDIRVDAAQPPGVLSLESGGERQSVFLGNVIKRRPE